MKKRLISLLLAAALVVGLVPAAAAFGDVPSGELSAKLELLQQLDIIDGYTDGTFRPNNTLTRAEFTKLIVTMLGGGDEAELYSGYTIFTDVTSGHWAAGCINYAAKSTESGGLSLIKGYTDGSFRPNAIIKFGEAVTIVLRALGWSDATVGYNWPADYITKASQSGISDGVTLSAEQPVTRADGARIFYNSLFAAKADGTHIIDGLIGETIASAVIADVSADGVSLYGYTGTFANAAGLVRDDVGRRYKVTLSKDGGTILRAEALEESGSSVTITFAYYSGDEVTAVDGTVYKVTADTVAYANKDGEDAGATTFGAIRDDLSYGDTLRLETDSRGRVTSVVALYGEAAVAVYEPGDTQSTVLAALGAPSGVRIYKNGAETEFSALSEYDVLSYVPGGAVVVSDFKLNAVYTYAVPNSAAPNSIRVYGEMIPLAPCAKESVAAFKPNARLCLLFAADGRIAGAKDPDGSRAVGMYTGSSVQFVGGPEVSMTLEKTETGELVEVSVDGKGAPKASAVRNSAPDKDLDLEKMTLGGEALAPDCALYERAAAGVLPVRISRSDITADTVAAKDIVHVGRNSDGSANLVIFGDVTGDRYEYGRMSYRTESVSVGFVGSTEVMTTEREITLDNANGSTEAPARPSLQMPAGLRESVGEQNYYYIWAGVLKGRYTSAAGRTDERMLEAKPLEEKYEVGRAGFDGSSAVMLDGKRVPIAPGVQVFIESVGSFMSPSDFGGSVPQMVSAARAQSDKFDVYTANGKVRVIVVK